MMYKSITVGSEYKKYKILYLRFWDHTSNNAEDLDCGIAEAMGILREETDIAYYIVAWVWNSNLSDSNSEGYCILKSTVLECIELERKYNDPKDAIGYQGGAKHSKSNRK